jgi:RNA polymerase sigma-70 factor (ECF subfamily)
MSGTDEETPRHRAAVAPDDGWATLMARAQRGDRAAYALLLREIAPYLRVVASGQVRGREDIEDVVQDILLTVHSVRSTYDPGRPFKPWLLAIARHRMLDWLRRRGRLARRERGLEAEDETFPAPGANLAMERLDARDLHRAIAALPPGQRQAVTLIKLGQMSLQEASQTTGLSVAALKVATHRAVLTLRRVLTRA